MQEENNIDLQMVLAEAQTAYLAQDYDTSIELYNALLEKHPSNPYLLVNAGNSYYQTKSFGDAISLYYQAKRMIPRNKELNNNLSIVMDEIELSQPPLLSFNYLTWIEWFFILLIVNLIFLFRKKLFKGSAKRFICSFVFVLMLSVFAWVTYEQKIQKFAVIKDVSVEAFSGDDEAYTKLFELLDGQIIEIIDEEVDWSKIKFNDTLGWVKNQSLRRI